MRVIQEAEGVFRLPVHTPFPIGPTNVYALEGEGLALFDTGIGAERTWNDLLEGLAELGRRPSDVSTVVVSHAHIDHHGLAARFSEAQVLVGRPDLPAVQDVDGYNSLHNDIMRSLLKTWDLPDDAAVMEALSGLGDWSRSVPAARAIDEGPVAGLAGFTSLAMPGHTEGLTCLFRPSDGLLLSSDHLLPTITPNPAVFTDETPPRSGLPDYLASLRRLLDLGVDRVLPGHGEPFDFSAAHVHSVLAHHEERLQHVLQLVQEGGSTVFALTTRLFPRLDPFNFFLAMREVFGHLEILVERRVLSVDLRDGVSAYVTTGTT